MPEGKKQEPQVQPKIPGLPKGTKMKVYKFRFDLRKLVVWLVILLVFVPWLFTFIDSKVQDNSVTVTQAMLDVQAGRVERVEVVGDQLLLSYREGGVKISSKEASTSFTELLTQYQIDPATVEFEVYNSTLWDKLSGIANFVMAAAMVVIVVMIIRQAKGMQGGGGMFGMGRSRAKLFAKGKQDVKFSDVAGVDEAKRELEEVVDFLKNPKKYQKVGARTPKGVLLVGPAGVGKTLMARAVAGEASVAFFSMAGSEFMEMLVGVGASRVRDLFETAKKTAPAIIFIDEIDAIGRTRGYGAMGGHDERDQTLNQILVEIDGFSPSDNVIVMAATNRPDVLDEALIRPGRFDRRVTLDMPDIEGRKAIMKIHAKGKPFAKKLDWEAVARRTVGFSGADLENMLNEAAIGIARENRAQITFADIEEAATKVKLGPEKKRMQSQEDRKMTAYHEAGHALVTHYLTTTDPVHRISIVSRGMALGFTLIPPAADRYQRTRTEILEEICTLLGGRAAEELVYKELTAGAASDIDKVTRLARAMVVDYGMSSLGPIDFGSSEGVGAWGRTYLEPTDVSEVKRAEIDKEVEKIVRECERTTRAILLAKRKEMDRVVEALMRTESLEKEEFEKLVATTKDEVRREKKYKVSYSE